MNRDVLDELLHALSSIVGERDLVMIGSQSIHAITSDVPIEVVMSRECDLLLDESDPLTSAIAAVPDLHMRVVLAARLQIVLEGSPR
jgi:hypothetical protein